MGLISLRELREAFSFVRGVNFWRMAILWTFFFVISYLQLVAQNCFSRKSLSSSLGSSSSVPQEARFIAKIAPSRRPVCIITGASSGLGLAAAHALAKRGFYVVLTGRSSDLLSKVVSDIKIKDNDACVKAFQLDLTSFQSILDFKCSLEQWLVDTDMHCSVQLLINNAGILATSYRLTSEGLDQMMATNYLGAFSLTKVLLPLLRNSVVPCRVVNVTSFTHRSVSSMRTDRETISGKALSESRQYPFAQVYEYSKLCLLLFTYELHRQFSLEEKSYQVSVMAADPGLVETNIMREFPSWISRMAFSILKFLGLLQSPQKGISSILDAVLAPPETSGGYFFGGNGGTLNSSALSYNPKLSKDLWATSCGMLEEFQQTCKATSK